ncbi:Glycosyltransferase Family 1 protein [Glomus cerebriforme]|uniref:Glycosyltransferase Family 1 protein n=1 Tax=Glomus cerebriforme TaxID=658196 RepID=A0A397SW38_9GLOM|nr:Glycosyltransferase Family 1 protein [Glomus cerebriforme]
MEELFLLPNKNPNISMESFAPQFSILNHTNTKLFLSHSGSGSVYESLYTGTPILALPITFDQPVTAEKLELNLLELANRLVLLNINFVSVRGRISFDKAE